MQPADERSERVFPEAVQPMTRFAVHVEGADERRTSRGQDEPWHERRQRLVHMDHVERSTCQTTNGGSSARIEAEPGICAAQRDEDRVPERVLAVDQRT